MNKTSPVLLTKQPIIYSGMIQVSKIRFLTKSNFFVLNSVS